MRRIFIFGCSFTQYIWPTWADVLEHDSNVPVYNYGLSGIGNVGISHKILEADLRHRFNSDDSIYILWTTWYREDRMFLGEWKRLGNVFNNYHYKKDFYKYCCDSDFFVKNASAIISVNKTYKDLIKFQAHIKPLDQLIPDSVIENYPNLHDFYFKHIENKELHFSPSDRYNSFDEHPTMIDHIDFLENIVGIGISKKSKKYFYKIHDNLKDSVSEYDNEAYSRIHLLWKKQQTLGFK